jgi:hypothetical protein
LAGEDDQPDLRAWQRKYRDDPVAFARECIDWPGGEVLAPYQAESLAAIPQYKRVSVRAPHSAGKSALAAIAVLWFVLTRDGIDDWKAALTASAWRQLTHYLCPEVHKWAAKLRWQTVIPRPPFDSRTEFLTLNLKGKTGEAFPMATNESAKSEGLHAGQVLYVFDESKAIPDPIWEGAEGAFASGSCYWLSISTPGSNSGRFFDIQTRKPGTEDWWVRHVTMQEALDAGRMNLEWAEQRKAQWGESSPAYITRVLGEFAQEDSAGVIPLAWVEAAQERWLEWKEQGFPGKVVSLGVDVGGGLESGDRSVIAVVCEGARVRELRVTQGARDPHLATMELCGQVQGIVHAQKPRHICIDSIGIGLGACERLRELGNTVIGFGAGNGTQMLDRSGELGFQNWRSAAWWLTRELLQPGSGFAVALPPDEETGGLLVGELCAPRYRVVSGGALQVESKDTIRKRLGRSTDHADAVIQALIGPALQAERDAGEGPRYNIVYDPVVVS